MKNKFTKVFAVCAAVFIASTGFSFANSADNLPIPKVKQSNVKTEDIPEFFKITTPEEKNILTTSSKLAISGIAKQGDNVKVEVYFVTVSKNKDGVDMNKTLIDSFETDVDKLGIFAQEVNLSKGENIIYITLTRDSKEYKYMYNVSVSNSVSRTLDKKIKITDTKDII